jgi:hypothetical protein
MDLQSNVSHWREATVRFGGRTRSTRRATDRTASLSQGAASTARRTPDAFALDAGNGHMLWQRHLTSATEQFVDVAPIARKGFIFTATTGYPPGGRGKIYALDATTGATGGGSTRSRIRGSTRSRAGGGGSGSPCRSTTSAPPRWHGEPGALGRDDAVPERGRLPGPVPFTDSLSSCSTPGRAFRSGATRSRRTTSATTTSRRLDPPGRRIVGAGKAGRVIAWDARTHAPLGGPRRRALATTPGRSRRTTSRSARAPARRRRDADGRGGWPRPRPCCRPLARTAVPRRPSRWIRSIRRKRAASWSRSTPRTGTRFWTRRFPSALFAAQRSPTMSSSRRPMTAALCAGGGRRPDRRTAAPARASIRARSRGRPALAGAGVRRPGSVPELVAFSASG